MNVIWAFQHLHRCSSALDVIVRAYNRQVSSLLPFVDIIIFALLSVRFQGLSCNR